MQRLALFIASFVSVCSLHAEPELRGTASELAAHLQTIPRSVFIAGEGKVEVQADRAMVNLSVVTEHKSLSEALGKNESRRKELIQALVGKGIPKERIETSRFSSTPEYGHWSDKAKSYKVDNQVKVKIESENQFRDVAALVDQWTDVHYVSLEPEHSDKDERKLEAIAKAVEDAMKKKEAYEKALHVKLVLKGFGGASPSGGVGTLILPGSTDGLLTAGVRSYRSMPSFAGAIPKKSTGESTSEGSDSFGEIIFRTAIEVEFTIDSR